MREGRHSPARSALELYGRRVARTDFGSMPVRGRDGRMKGHRKPMQTATDLFPWATRALSGRGLAHPPIFTAVNAIAHGARFTPEGCLTRETVRCPSRYQRGTGFSAEPAIRVSGSPAPDPAVCRRNSRYRPAEPRRCDRWQGGRVSCNALPFYDDSRS